MSVQFSSVHTKLYSSNNNNYYILLLLLQQYLVEDRLADDITSMYVNSNQST